MTDALLSYNFPWTAYPQNLYPRIAREYLDYGIDRFVFVESWIAEGLKHPELIDFLRDFKKKMGIHIVSIHAPAGREFDLNIPEKERRPAMIKDHIKAMEIAAEFDSKTYTIHVGAWHHCIKHVDMNLLRPLAIETLEQLVPAAEKIGIVVAVENSFEPPNSMKEVVGLVEPFASSPAIGICYDTGHAHFMAPYPWKKMEDYPKSQHDMWWEHGIIEEANALELAQKYVVTTHIHDNTGYADLHSMPFDGTLDWYTLMPKLRACPRMMEYQTEIEFSDGVNWAGQLLAPVGGYSIKRQVETFRKLGF
jgi:sugar phosphate isomerase/epimerase